MKSLILICFIGFFLIISGCSTNENNVPLANEITLFDTELGSLNIEKITFTLKADPLAVYSQLLVITGGRYSFSKVASDSAEELAGLKAIKSNGVWSVEASPKIKDSDLKSTTKAFNSLISQFINYAKNRNRWNEPK